MSNGSQTISVHGGGIDEILTLTKFAHKVTQMEHKLTNDVDHALLDSSLYVFINLYTILHLAILLRPACD